MKLDLALMRQAVMQAMAAMQPVIVEHGAARALPAIATAMGLMVVGCHRVGANSLPVAQTTELLARRFGESVGEALSGAAEADAQRGQGQAGRA